MSKGIEQEKRFAARLSRIRKARSLTQQQVADAAGVSRQAVALAEVGQKRIRLSDAVDISDALDVPLLDMLSPEPMRLHVSVPID